MKNRILVFTLLTANLIACSHLSNREPQAVDPILTPNGGEVGNRTDGFFWENAFCKHKKNNQIEIIPIAEIDKCGSAQMPKPSFVLQSYNSLPYNGTESIIEPDWDTNEPPILQELFKRKDVVKTLKSKFISLYDYRYVHINDISLELKGNTNDGKKCIMRLSKTAYANGLRDFSKSRISYKLHINSDPNQKIYLNDEKFGNNFAQCEAYWPKERMNNGVALKDKNSVLTNLQFTSNTIYTKNEWVDVFNFLNPPYDASQVELLNDGSLRVSCNTTVRHATKDGTDKYFSHKIENCNLKNE